MISKINNSNLCTNPRPPINHDIKYAEEKEISDDVAKFLDSGGEIKQVPSFGHNAKPVTYKQRNDSYFGMEVKV